jgi:hypothetical protein
MGIETDATRNSVFSAITDFWGFRAGGRNVGAIEVENASENARLAT